MQALPSVEGLLIVPLSLEASDSPSSMAADQQHCYHPVPVTGQGCGAVHF